tara:strand:- start:11 stop:817 length:807 start_codon:yes stop_codon:yes gene_type:complete
MLSTLPPLTQLVKYSNDNRFDLQRRYLEKDLEKIFKFLAEKAAKMEKTRFISFGAEDGYVLVKAFEYFLENVVHYIGIEAGSLVGNGKYGEILNKAMENFENLPILVHGMEKETLFEYAMKGEHAIATLSVDIPSIGHFYDGGVVLKDVMTGLYELIHNTFADDSIVVFVTSMTPNDKYVPNKFADYRHICENMVHQKHWKLFKRYEIEEERNPIPNPTMWALFFKKVPLPSNSQSPAVKRKNHSASAAALDQKKIAYAKFTDQSAAS